ALKASAESSSGNAAAHSEPGRPRSTPETQTATTAKPAGKPTVYQTKWRRMDPSEIAQTKKPVPVATSKGTTSAASQEAPAMPSKQEATTMPSKPPTNLQLIPSHGDQEDSSANSPPSQVETAALSKPSLSADPAPPQISSADAAVAKPQKVVVTAA